MSVNASLVKELRKETSAPVIDCKKALETTDGNIEDAIAWLRDNGLSKAAKKAGRSANDGMVDSYIHHGHRIGVMGEINCESDFVARSEEFQELVHDLLMHIAMTNPDYVDIDEIPDTTLVQLRSRFRAEALNDGKPEHIADKIVEGQIEKYYREACLLRQPFIKNEEILVQDLVNQMISKVGENIVVQRFVRYELGT